MNLRKRSLTCTFPSALADIGHHMDYHNCKSPSCRCYLIFGTISQRPRFAVILKVRDLQLCGTKRHAREMSAWIPSVFVSPRSTLASCRAVLYAESSNRKVHDSATHLCQVCIIYLAVSVWDEAVRDHLSYVVMEA